MTVSGRMNTLLEEFAHIEVADVVPDVEAADIQPFYTYRVPEALAERAATGACVLVEFGGSERQAYVLGRRRIPTDNPMARRLKDILDVVRAEALFSEEQADLARWMTGRYVCDMLSAVRCVAPPPCPPGCARWWSSPIPRITGADVTGSVVQAHVVETLRALGSYVQLEALRAAANVSAFTGAFAALNRRGLVRLTRELARAEVVDRTVRAFELAPTDAEPPRISPAGRRIVGTLARLGRGGASRRRPTGYWPARSPRRPR